MNEYILQTFSLYLVTMHTQKPKFTIHLRKISQNLYQKSMDINPQWNKHMHKFVNILTTKIYTV